jgi:DNA-binding response OmpR family regulator
MPAGGIGRSVSPDSSSHGRGKEAILIIEDDRALREGLAMNLRLQGYEILTAADGEEGMKMAFDSRPDLIVLDIMMPCWTGLDILEELRKRGEEVPVLILSARDGTPDKVEGLNLGADDYMTKPFDLPELIARIEARLRGCRSERKDMPKLCFGDVTIDRATRSVRVLDNEIELSAKEFDLLCLLAASPGKVFTRETILERVWGWDYDGTSRTVDNFVAGLRKKLRMGRRGTKYIRTVPRVGYKIAAE